MESLNLQAFSNSALNNSVERFRRALPENKQPARNEELFKVCQDFEAIFIKQMLSAIKKTVPRNDLLNGGFAEEIFEACSTTNTRLPWPKPPVSGWPTCSTGS